MKLIIDKEDKMTITVFCWEQDGEVEASWQKSDIPKEITDKVEKVEFVFRKPGYGDSNTIMRNAGLKIDGDKTHLDASSFQNQILKTLLIEWTLKQDDKVVSLNSANLNNLVPSVARAAVSGVMEKIRF